MAQKLLLIWPYNEHSVHIFETFPIGIGYLLANLEDQYDVDFLDCTLDKLHPESEEFLKKLELSQPDIVGISFWSSNAKMVYKTVESVHQLFPDTKIVFGGPHATSYGKYEIEEKHADYVISGEAETSLPQLIDAIDANDTVALGKIKGLIYRDDDDNIIANELAYEVDLDVLGEVNYTSLNLAEYHRQGYNYSGSAVLHDDMKTALIISTRGCPYRCRFCSAPLISGKRIRMHSPEYVARTIQSLYDEYGVKSIALGDDNFTLKKKFAISLCQAIIDLGLDDLVLSAPNGIRLTKLDKELAQYMRRAGFEEVAVAPESGSPRTLELMHKDTETHFVRPFVDMCHSVDLKVKANFIIGYPGETIEDVLLTEQFIMDHDFDQIGLCFFQPLPGTPVFDDLIERNEIPSSFVPGRYNQLTYCPEGMDKDELCAAFNRIMNAFRDSKGWKYKNDKVGTIRT